MHDILAPFLPIPPTAPIQNVFTTSPHLHALQPFIPLLFLAPDSALGIHKVSNPKVFTHRVVRPPPPSSSANVTDPPHSSHIGEGSVLPEEAWEAFYPAGSINPNGEIKGGFGFYMKGPKPFEQALERKNAVEVVSGYEVMFEEGFEWVKGGKLPGVCAYFLSLYGSWIAICSGRIDGGIGDSAYGCTGGRKEQRCNCFNLRTMWRANGEAELYAYLPLLPSNTRALLSVPNSHENSDYGFSVGRGAWRFESGRWFAVAIRVKLNEVGREDGEIDIFVDGQSVISVRGLVFREDAQSKVKGMHFQTFFGGHTPDWASPKDQRAWFSSVSGAVLGATNEDREYSRDEL